MPNPYVSLRDLLTDRLAQGTVIAPSELAAHLQDRCRLDARSADGLAWGEAVQLTADQLDLLAIEFGLHRELLGMLMTPTSEETAEETVRRAAAECLSPADCRDCADMASAAELIADRDELDALALRMLGHLTPASQVFTEVVALPEMEELAEVLQSLSQEARHRVLRYAYHELGQQNQPAAGF